MDLARTSRLGAAIAVALLVNLVPAAQGAPVKPRLGLRVATSSVTAIRPPGEPMFFEPGIYLAVHDAPFELRATRPDYTAPPTLQQILHGDGTTTPVDLPAEVLDGWIGLDDFLTLEVHKDGELLKRRIGTFCPNGWERQRIDDTGPNLPTYPEGCYGNPFTRGMVWGIDEGWAASAMPYGMRPMRIPDGTYDMTLSIADRYVELFDIEPSRAHAEVELVVETYEEGACFECRHGHRATREREARAAQGTVPTMTEPDPAILPDLVALPAWGLHVSNGRRVTRLRFGATVWSGGASPLVVEGFRREGEDLMDAFQYFYEDGEVIGRAPAGGLEFDTRDGHQHWHFLQFARYSLLDQEQAEVLRSKKESFCLAPTDAIDLTLPGATLRPGSTGLHTACGGSRSLWVRETLPLGWGDTYFQSVPGQAFDITDLPNGTYYLAVETNPDGLLYEQSADNNIELREIHLRGRAGRRYVEVPPWNGIDTESTYPGGGCERC